MGAGGLGELSLVELAAPTIGYKPKDLVRVKLLISPLSLWSNAYSLLHMLVFAFITLCCNVLALLL